ncbi:MAG: 5'/3'-nucleotidase SurE [Acidimicrobiales bacterium]|nr:5'/3'-nucleotidase SurE [Acidimicrobiales bacterium]
MPIDPRHLVLAAALAVAPLAACSSDGSDGDAAPETTAADATEAPEVEPLKILVTNDDGYDAPGIDALVEGLATLDDVEVTVVAPLEQQSGTGGSVTEGDVATSEVTTASGHEAIAVDGFPADAVAVALDDEGVEADLVISGINSGQNLGPLVDLSGTVGAARAAVARGVPALATSQGFGEPEDYPSAVPLILDWVTEHRDDLVAGDATVEVINLNVPTCTAGEVLGLIEATVGVEADGNPAEQEVDCSDAAVAMGDGAADVSAFNAGYATIGVVPAEPADE